MSEADFRANRRQKFLTEKYFRLNQIFLGMLVEAGLEAIRSEQEVGNFDCSSQGGVFKDKLKLLRLNYTAGAQIEAVKPLYSEAMKWFEEWHHADHLWTEARIKETGKDLRLDGTPVHFEDLFHFQLVLDMVSLGLLLGEPDAVRRIAKLLVQYRHTDLLFESLIGKAISDPDTDTTEFFHEQPYDPLIDAFYSAETDSEAIGYMKRYLDGWYKAFEGAPWHDGHLAQTEEYSAYEGYWAFEAAAVCVLYGIDDTSFRDHIVYPKDLADWARAHRVMDHLAPDGGLGSTGSAHLRCEAGEPCPHTGWWTPPSGTGTTAGRQHFTAGTVMPSLGNTAWVTIWQFDEKQAGDA